MSYRCIGNNTYLAPNGVEYYGWVGRHILDSDNFYTKKGEGGFDFEEREHPANYRRDKTYKEKYCWGCETHKDIRDFSFVSHKSTKRKKLCKECVDYALHGRSVANQKRQAREKLLQRRNEDPIFNFMTKTRGRISNSIRNRSKDTIELLGCSPEFAYQYLVSKFTEDMTEEAFMDGEIHIDHIKPVTSFDLHDEKQLRECFHYTNLQPLWASDNLSKGNKVVKK